MNVLSTISCEMNGPHAIAADTPRPRGFGAAAVLITRRGRSGQRGNAIGGGTRIGRELQLVEDAQRFAGRARGALARVGAEVGGMTERASPLHNISQRAHNYLCVRA